MSQKEIDSICPESRSEWRRWLEINHQIKDSIWLIIHKKTSENQNITWSEAVDEALCFGWIDSLKKPIDNQKYKQFFSKRKPFSTWSKINKEKVALLTKNGLMFDAGIKSIDIAKKNGSWTILDEVEAVLIPSDLGMELQKYAGAQQFFENLSKSDKKRLLAWIVLAKRSETRAKRIIEIGENAGNHKLPKSFR